METEKLSSIHEMEAGDLAESASLLLVEWSAGSLSSLTRNRALDLLDRANRVSPSIKYSKQSRCLLRLVASLESSLLACSRLSSMLEILYVFSVCCERDGTDHQSFRFKMDVRGAFIQAAGKGGYSPKNPPQLIVTFVSFVVF